MYQLTVTTATHGKLHPDIVIRLDLDVVSAFVGMWQSCIVNDPSEFIEERGILILMIDYLVRLNVSQVP
jgi:hypothetical protein